LDFTVTKLLDIYVLVIIKYSYSVKGGDTCPPLEERQKMGIEEFKNMEDVRFLKGIKGCQPISTKNGTHSG